MNNDAKNKKKRTIFSSVFSVRREDVKSFAVLIRQDVKAYSHSLRSFVEIKFVLTNARSACLNERTKWASPRLPVLTFDKLLRRAHTLAVHSHEIHAGGHVAEVDAGMVLSELYGLDHLAEGVIDDSFLHFNIAVDA